MFSTDETEIGTARLVAVMSEGPHRQAGLRLTAIPIVIGLIGAAGAMRLLASQLFGVTPSDPLTFAVVPAVLGAVAIIACYLPARRASRLDPPVALRRE